MTLSAREKLWLVVGAVAAFLMLLVGYFMFISPQKSQTSSINAQVASVDQANTQLRAKVKALSEQNADLAKYQAQVAAAQLAMPSDPGVPEFLRMLQTLGSATQVSVSSVSFSPPAAVKGASGAASTGSPAGSGGTSASAGSTAKSGAGAASTAGVYQMTVNLSVTGAEPAVERFLRELQSVQPRAVLINGISDSSGASGGKGGAASGPATLSFSLQTFVAPGTAATTKK